MSLFGKLTRLRLVAMGNFILQWHSMHCILCIVFHAWYTTEPYDKPFWEKSMWRRKKKKERNKLGLSCAKLSSSRGLLSQL